MPSRSTAARRSRPSITTHRIGTSVAMPKACQRGNVPLPGRHAIAGGAPERQRPGGGAADPGEDEEKSEKPGRRGAGRLASSGGLAAHLPLAGETRGERIGKRAQLVEERITREIGLDGPARHAGGEAVVEPPPLGMSRAGAEVIHHEREAPAPALRLEQPGGRAAAVDGTRSRPGRRRWLPRGSRGCHAPGAPWRGRPRAAAPARGARRAARPPARGARAPPSTSDAALAPRALMSRISSRERRP